MRRLLPSTHALRAFEACARHLSVSRAAEELDLTQSAVSRQLSGLEEQLGIALFRRVRQRLVLTPAGALYAPAVSSGLSKIEGATEKLLLDERTGRSLVIAVGSTFGARWLVPRLNEFRSKYPEIMPDIVTFAHSSTPYDFGVEKVDAVIHYGENPWPNTTSHRLCDEVCVPVCAPELLGKGLRSIQDLRKLTVLHLKSRPTSWKEWLTKARLPTTDNLRGPMFQTMAMMGEAAVVGVGVALMPPLLIADDIKSGRLAVASTISIKTGSYFLTYPKRQLKSVPALRAFKQWLVGHPKLEVLHPLD